MSATNIWILTASIELVELFYIIVAHIQSLSNHILELRQFCNDGWSISISEGIFGVVHNREVVVWGVHGAVGIVRSDFEIMLLP